MTVTVDQPDDMPPDPDLDDTATDTDPAKKARSEAAAYRRRLREAEAERDAARAELDGLKAKELTRQRADVETMAAEQLKDGSDLWTATDVAALLDDVGDIDQAKVTEAVKQLVAAKPHYATPRPDFDLGQRGGNAAEGPTFADVLRQR